MNSITAAGNNIQQISLLGVKGIDATELKSINIAEASPEIYKQFMEGQERFLETMHQKIKNYHGNPVNDTYATIMKNGEVIATIDNNGGVSSTNTMGGRLRHLLSGDVNGRTGPVLAQRRAEEIIEAMGGEIHMSDTALTQDKYNRTPKPYLEVDVAAMNADPMFQNLMNMQKARAAYLAK